MGVPMGVCAARLCGADEPVPREVTDLLRFGERRGGGRAGGGCGGREIVKEPSLAAASTAAAAAWFDGVAQAVSASPRGVGRRRK